MAERTFNYMAALAQMFREYSAKRLAEIKEQQAALMDEAAMLESFFTGENLPPSPAPAPARRAKRVAASNGAVEPKSPVIYGLSQRVREELQAAGTELRVGEIVERLVASGWKFNNPARAAIAVTRVLETDHSVTRRKAGPHKAAACFYSLPSPPSPVTETEVQ